MAANVLVEKHIVFEFNLLTLTTVRVLHLITQILVQISSTHNLRNVLFPIRWKQALYINNFVAYFESYKSCMKKLHLVNICNKVVINKVFLNSL